MKGAVRALGGLFQIPALGVYGHIHGISLESTSLAQCVAYVRCSTWIGPYQISPAAAAFMARCRLRRERGPRVDQHPMDRCLTLVS